MQLHSYNDFLRDWMYLERYVNDGSDHKFKDQTEVPLEFQPRSSVYSIPIFDLKDISTKTENILPSPFFPVHPYTAKLYKEAGHIVESTSYKGIPTSSTRTVLISKDNFQNSYLVKLDLPLKISRFNRSVTKSDVIFSQQINNELANFRMESNAAIGTFLEPGGGFATLKNGKDVGYIARDLTPKFFEANLTGTYYLVPSFSLISQDLFHPHDAPLLIQLLKDSADPANYVLDRIMLPLLDYWFALADIGIIWELQQQNTLFVMNHKKEIIGLVSRDFDGIYIDARHRKRKGLSHTYIKHVISDPTELSIRYSLTFDHRVCKQNLVRMLTCIAGVDKNLASKVELKLIEYIDYHLPQHIKDLLPKDAWYTCPEVMFEQEIKTILLPQPPLRH